MKSNALTFVLILLLSCGCSSAQRVNSTDREASLEKLYAQAVASEGGDLQSSHTNLVYQQYQITSEIGRNFWNSFEEYRDYVGTESAEKWLSGLVEIQGVCTVLISFNKRDAVSNEFVRDQIQRREKRTRFFRYVVGDPIDWERVGRYQEKGLNGLYGL